MLDDSILNQFASVDVLKNTDIVLATQLLEATITKEVTRKLESSIFTDAFIHYKLGTYSAVGNIKGHQGNIVFSFNSDFTKVGFDTDHGFQQMQNVPTKLKKYMEACISNMKNKARLVETIIVKQFLASEVRYGNESELEAQWYDFATKELTAMSEGHEDFIAECFPIDINIKSSLVDYITERGGDVSKLHITNN